MPPPHPAVDTRPRGLSLPIISTRIAGKIIAPYLFIIVALSVLALFITTRVVTDTINDYFVQKLQDSAQIAVNLLQQEERTGTAGAPLDRLLARVAADVRAELTLYDDAGAVVVSTLVAKGTDADSLRLSGDPRLRRLDGATAAPLGTLPIRPVTGPVYTELIRPAELRALPGTRIGVAVPNVFIGQSSSITRTQLLIAFAAVMALALFVGLLLARTITRPIAALTRAASRVQDGDLTAHVPVTTRDEVGLLARSFNQMVADLRRGREAEALARALQQQELERARRIQERLLPAALPAWPGRLEIAARLRPALETSGDFYDVVPVGPTHSNSPRRSGSPLPLQIAVTDVQGKGLGAALVAVQAHSVLRAATRLREIPATATSPATAQVLAPHSPVHAVAHAATNGNRGTAGSHGAGASQPAPATPAGQPQATPLSPAEALRLVARLHHESHGGQDFVTCALALLEPCHDPATGEEGVRLHLANAAQVPPLLCRGGSAVELVPPGDRLPLGIFADSHYRDLTVDLVPGDVVVFASDGVPEAPAQSGGQLFGFARLAESAAHWACRAPHATAILEGIWSDITAWSGPESHHDDMTLLVLRVPHSPVRTSP